VRAEVKEKEREGKKKKEREKCHIIFSKRKERSGVRNFKRTTHIGWQ
jgi:hypothetical protein